MEKKWEVKGNVLSNGIFEEEFYIEGMCFYTSDNNKNYMKTLVTAVSTKEARQLTLESFERICGFMSFSTDSKFTLVITDVAQIIEEGEIGHGESDKFGSFTIPNKITNQDIEEIKGLLKTSTSLDDIIQSAIKYYERGIKIEEWTTEAFINFFKVIELISDKYFDEAQKQKKEQNKKDLDKNVSRIIKEIKKENCNKNVIIKAAKKIYNIGRVERRLRIELAASDLKADGFNIKRLVDVRNRVSAHGNRQSEVLNPEDAILCKEFSKKMILGYMAKRVG